MTDLSRLIRPRSIALVGASDRQNSIGERTLTNLLDHSEFDGDIYLVNTTKDEIRGRRCWPSVASLPATPDLAVIVVPASGVLTVAEECAARGVPFAIVLTSGFGEAGEEGERAQARLKEIADAGGMRLYGPNCPGLTNVNHRLGLTFSPSFPHDLVKGPIGLATQGGGLGRNVMQAMDRGIGIGLWASTGNEVDLQVADFIHYMADAPDIKVIVTLLEGIKDGPRFVAALERAAANGKPVIALKVGKSEYGQRAAQSHTASLTGSAEVNSAVFRQFGVIEVDDIDELVDTAWLFARAQPGAAEGLAIYTSSGGTAALTADAVGLCGLTLATFAPHTRETLRELLPDYAAIDNPVDTTAAVLSDSDIAVEVADMFDIDATEFNIELVADFTENGHTVNVGKPTVLLVFDRRSRKVVGWYVYYGNENWEEGYRLAIFCALCGEVKQRRLKYLDIDELETYPLWVENPKPRYIYSDNGPNASGRAQAAFDRLNISPMLAPPGYPHWKPTVEGGLGNFQAKHAKLAGGWARTRRSRDKEARRLAKKMAGKTKREFETLLVLQIIEYNANLSMTHRLNYAMTQDGVKGSSDAIFSWGVRRIGGIQNRVMDTATVYRASPCPRWTPTRSAKVSRLVGSSQSTAAHLRPKQCSAVALLPRLPSNLVRG
uniref:CoA-binding protein n=1 Tax=Calothrix sp. FACHB-1219 TaxID=2692778 RepID=UPI0018EF743B